MKIPGHKAINRCFNCNSFSINKIEWLSTEKKSNRNKRKETKPTTTPSIPLVDLTGRMGHLGVDIFYNA